MISLWTLCRFKSTARKRKFPAASEIKGQLGLRQGATVIRITCSSSCAECYAKSHRGLASKRAGTARAVGAPDVRLASRPRRSKGRALIGEEDQLQLACPQRNICVRPTTREHHARSIRSPPGMTSSDIRARASFRPIGLSAAGISNVPHDPDEHQKRGRPRQQGSDDHRCYRCHDSSLMRPAHAIDIPESGGKQHRRIIFARRPTAQDIYRAISNRPCCAPADVCRPRGTWSSKIARSTG
jgi:hypothetical protein